MFIAHARYRRPRATSSTPSPLPRRRWPVRNTSPPRSSTQLWTETAAAFRTELADSKASVQEFLQRKNPAWHLVGRVHFNLAENRRDDEAPFAFLATYTTQLSAQAKAQHLPLGRALSEYAGAANKTRLLSLLLPVQRASRRVRVAEGDGRRGRDLITRCAGRRPRRFNC